MSLLPDFLYPGWLLGRCHRLAVDQLPAAVEQQDRVQPCLSELAQHARIAGIAAQLGAAGVGVAFTRATGEERIATAPGEVRQAAPINSASRTIV